ncbi:LacI family DNA-binding transcriptional regulator [Microbacterium capsulatum]|uniref:LacI family DNA-binding transcriptional regulator n=1 Tax=Microbacterium capsulatum TaxID=3041921 RepID=A0ABU0XIN3_9MICO|nr:LacI family DNA-binding transcriptional regulator [Microbacterium sp. ASV81]MDQ4214981.1 LacI family DNA-binding transcriptional regulator [Microbacterium sp. ASV81]
MVTSRDVAQHAGVSQATVSRVLSSATSIAPATRARVLAAMSELGYVPHAGAQAMKTRRTNVIGVVVDDLRNPFYSQLLDELTRILNEHHYRVVVWNAGSSSHVDALAAIQESAVDGVVFTTATADSPELQAAVGRGLPLLLINREVDGLDCDRVTGENTAGGTLVADFLVGRGRTDVAIIAGSHAATTSRQRTEAFFARMAELGHPVPEHLRFDGKFSHDLAAEITRRLMSRAERPRAIFCLNDYMAFGALDALRDLGIGPEECWVIGYDDVDMASWASYDLTTVRQSSHEMATAGAAMLMERLADPHRLAQALRFPSTLIERGSTP